MLKSMSESKPPRSEALQTSSQPLLLSITQKALNCGISAEHLGERLLFVAFLPLACGRRV